MIKFKRNVWTISLVSLYILIHYHAFLSLAIGPWLDKDNIPVMPGRRGVVAVVGVVVVVVVHGVVAVGQ